MEEQKNLTDLFCDAYASTEQKVIHYCTKILDKVCYQLIKTNKFDKLIEEFKDSFKTDFLKDGRNCTSKIIMYINDEENKEYVDSPSNVTILDCKNIFNERSLNFRKKIKAKGHILDKCVINLRTDTKGFYVALSIAPPPVGRTICIIL